MQVNKNKWMIYKKKISPQARSTGLSGEILQILANRDIVEKEDIEAFINPSMDSLHDPFLMADMEEAVDIILEAADSGKHIHIVGDYDQDGNSSTVTLVKGLKELTDKVTYAIPNRIEDGYGINKDMVDFAVSIGVDLIITCDNGISAHEAVAYAKEKGLQIIVTDHHKVKMEGEEMILPEADAVINPQRLDCPYPFKSLCGAGVAFKLICALYDSLGIDVEKAYDLLEFVAMATVCDVVDLVGENRTIVVEGLKKLNKSKNLGILALKEAAAWNKEFSVYALGFVIGPCINASGRLSTARLGIELFLDEDFDRVRLYADELVRLNNERKELTRATYEYVLGLIENSQGWKKNVILAFAPEAHESIVGIVAGRIKDKFYRPCLVFAKAQEEGIIKGSGRSIETYDMFTEVNKARDILKSFGGHKMACGLSLDLDRFEELDNFLQENNSLDEDSLTREITIDLAKEISSLTEEFINSLAVLSPFGKGNSKPVFADKAVDVLAYQIIGKNRNVIKLNLFKNGRVLEAISFSKSEEIESFLLNKFGRENLENYNMNTRRPNLVDLIYYPSINEFRGNKSIQLEIVDIR